MNHSKLIYSLIFSAILSANSYCQESRPRTLSDQPIEQQSAVREILRLGGDWEAGPKTVLIGFFGEKFTEEKFQLLTPLVDLRILYLSELPVDDSALEHCTTLKQIEQLQIEYCKFTGVGLKHFKQSKNLKRIHFQDTPITDEGLTELAKFASLELLEINHTELSPKITAKGIRQLKSLKKLKHLWLDMNTVPEGLKEELQKSLPKCDISLSEVP